MENANINFNRQSNFDQIIDKGWEIIKITIFRDDFRFLEIREIGSNHKGKYGSLRRI